MTDFPFGLLGRGSISIQCTMNVGSGSVSYSVGEGRIFLLQHFLIHAILTVVMNYKGDCGI